MGMEMTTKEIKRRMLARKLNVIERKKGGADSAVPLMAVIGAN